MPQFGQITPAQAFRLIGTPDAPTILDVRTAEDIAALPRLIPGARLLPHDQIATLTVPPGRVITVCTKGKKLSEGAAAWLRSQGWQAEVLEGGALAWETVGLPMLPLSLLPPPGTPWVTRLPFPVHVIERVEERKAFGRSIGEFGLIKDKIAQMMAQTWALESAA